MISENMLDAANKQWYAVYTIVRHEKAACVKVSEKSIETFLPLREVMSHWKDRIKKVQLPLFPGYFFINTHASNPERLSVLNTRGVVRILSDGIVPAPIPADQINAIKTLLQSRQAYKLDEYREKGRDAIVVRGPLSGITGKIIERRGTYRLLLSIDLIQRSVTAEVDIRDVELT